MLIHCYDMMYGILCGCMHCGADVNISFSMKVVQFSNMITGK